MQQIAFLIQTLPVKTVDRRKQIIKEFVTNIQKCAEESQYQARLLEHRTGIKQKIYPIPSAKTIACRLGHIKEIHDLEWLLAACKESRHFSKAFYFHLRVK